MIMPRTAGSRKWPIDTQRLAALRRQVDELRGDYVSRT
jgi:hypothetical protein